MFTGVISDVFPVSEVESLNNFIRLSVSLNDVLIDGLKVGASIAVNGVCLTVVSIRQHIVTFDVMKETLRVTNLGCLVEGVGVNIERAARCGDDINGHLLSGHIHDTVKITRIIKEVTNVTIFFSVNDKFLDYLFPKGYVALNGVSLTIGESIDSGVFCVHFIPETLRSTNFGNESVGSYVNIEIDSQTQAVVDTVKKYLLKM